MGSGDDLPSIMPRRASTRGGIIKRLKAIGSELGEVKNEANRRTRIKSDSSEQTSTETKNGKRKTLRNGQGFTNIETNCDENMIKNENHNSIDESKDACETGLPPQPGDYVIWDTRMLHSTGEPESLNQTLRTRQVFYVAYMIAHGNLIVLGFN